MSVYTPPKLHAQSFINLQTLVKPINCQQNFSVLSSPQKLVYGRLASKNFRTLNIVYSLRTVKFCLEFLLFRFFLGPPISGKTHHKTAETSKTSVRTEDFSKIESNFFAGNSKILPVLRGVALNFLELPTSYQYEKMRQNKMHTI